MDFEEIKNKVLSALGQAADSAKDLAGKAADGAKDLAGKAADIVPVLRQHPKSILLLGCCFCACGRGDEE